MKKFFCDSDGKFQVVYFWVTLILTFVLLFLTLKLTDAVRNYINNKPLGISDAFFGILLGGVVVWAKFYNDKKKPAKADPVIGGSVIDEGDEILFVEE